MALILSSCSALRWPRCINIQTRVAGHSLLPFLLPRPYNPRRERISYNLMATVTKPATKENQNKGLHIMDDRPPFDPYDKTKVKHTKYGGIDRSTLATRAKDNCRRMGLLSRESIVNSSVEFLQKLVREPLRDSQPTKDGL
jgi:hypothetical protein